MAKRIYYIYNAETDNFERFYPSLRDRLMSIGRWLMSGILIGSALFCIVYFAMGSPSEEKLKQENAELRAHYDNLERRLTSSLRVMDIIKNRDDNFYRVMMQLDPVGKSRRYAGLDNSRRYENLATLSDAELVTRLTRRMDLLDRQLYAQSLSFDQLRSEAKGQHTKL